jgi:acetyl-CoA carboxylase carboxyl transferase subunit beta
VERGMIDRVVTRPELPAMLGSLLGTMMMGRKRAAAA